MGIATQLNTRTWMYRIAWILFALSLSIPAPTSLYRPGVTTFSGFFVVGKAVQWSEAYPAGVNVVIFLELMLFVLSLFTNVIFIFTLAIRDSPHVLRSWKVLLIGSLVINASVVCFFPVFARLPAYWLWLLAFAAANWALIFLPLDVPGSQRSPRRFAIVRSEPPESGSVPLVLWIWLGFTVFWLGVTTINFVLTPKAGQAPRARPGAFVPVALTGYFNDKANLVEPGSVQNFIQGLAASEKETSNQIVVAIYPHAPAGPIEDFTIRTAELSRLGRKGRDNGAILFVFLAERVARIEVGYGLEGALPDATARRILDEDLAPSFARGQYQEGFEGTLAAILNAVRDEYRNDRSSSMLMLVAQQVKAKLIKSVRQAWPFIRATEIDARMGIAFFGTLIGMGVWSGLVNTARLLHAMTRGVLNLTARRPLRTGIDKVDFDPIIDSLKVFVLLVVVCGTVVMVAGGGAFGGAGAMIRW